MINICSLIWREREIRERVNARKKERKRERSNAQERERERERHTEKQREREIMRDLMLKWDRFENHWLSICLILLEADFYVRKSRWGEDNNGRIWYTVRDKTMEEKV